MTGSNHRFLTAQPPVLLNRQDDRLKAALVRALTDEVDGLLGEARLSALRAIASLPRRNADDRPIATT